MGRPSSGLIEPWTHWGCSPVLGEPWLGGLRHNLVAGSSGLLGRPNSALRDSPTVWGLSLPVGCCLWQIRLPHLESRV